MKLLLKFKKIGAARYISHLDLLRCVQRTLRRIDAPIKYSQGFNPHPLLTFSQALPMNMESNGEYMLIELMEAVDINAFITAFNAGGYDGISVISGREYGADEPSPMAATAAALYHCDTDIAPDALSAAITGFLAQDSAIMVKERNGNKREVDVLPLIYRLTSIGSRVEMLISCGENNLPANALMEMLLAFSDNCDNIKCFDTVRDDLYRSVDGKFVPFIQ